MFVELYRTKLNIEDELPVGVTTAPYEVGVVPAGIVVNVESIAAINMETVQADGSFYHIVKLLTTADVTDKCVGNFYITDRDFERLVH